MDRLSAQGHGRSSFGDGRAAGEVTHLGGGGPESQLPCNSPPGKAGKGRARWDPPAPRDLAALPLGSGARLVGAVT